MTIFEIDKAILDCIDTETGEIVDIYKLESLEMERNKKISNVACWIKELKAEAEAINAEKQNLAKRQKVAENKAERLKQFLSMILQGETFKDARCSISYRRSSSVEISEDLDVNTLPDDLCNVTRTASKTAIKEAIESGEEIPGCQIVERQSVLIK